MNKYERGLTYIELMMSTVIASLIILGLSGVVGQAIHSGQVVTVQNKLYRDADFGMKQMVNAVSHSHHLLLPFVDNPATNWPENIRSQTFPATAPIGDSTYASAVLAVTLAYNVDRDLDGVFDADNDGDGLFDEDLPSDMDNNSLPGIYGIDDDGDGSIDEGDMTNNDEQSALSSEDPTALSGEDPLNGIDDDGDGSVDEDMSSDMDDNGCSGICGVDDDGDGNVDEGWDDDDDEDGLRNEDWYDPVVFFLKNGSLIQRVPNPASYMNSISPAGAYTESIIAGNVTALRIERRPASMGAPVLVDITLELSDPKNLQEIKLNSTVRLSGGL